MSDEDIYIDTPKIPSPHSPTVPVPSNKANANVLTGALKRVHPGRTRKKQVHFADTIGRPLTQIEYIQSSSDDELIQSSLLLGSSILLSSSPPLHTKNDLYLPTSMNIEHKPWSFDLTIKSKKQQKQKIYLKRFFCLYRQPNSQNADVYLHQISSSKIKLEYANIPLKWSTNGEQQLIGTLWVMNVAYHKYVSIRYTFNYWLNVYEHEAEYSHHSNDSIDRDQYRFSVNLPKDINRIDFVLRYCVNGEEYWDNNNGNNYTLETEPSCVTSTTISLPHDTDINEMRFY